MVGLRRRTVPCRDGKKFDFNPTCFFERQSIATKSPKFKILFDVVTASMAFVYSKKKTHPSTMTTLTYDNMLKPVRQRCVVSVFCPSDLLENHDGTLHNCCCYTGFHV